MSSPKALVCFMRRFLSNSPAYFFFCLFVFLLWPQDAFAWGPAVHAQLAINALLQLGMLSPALRKLLERHPNDFIYGNLSADIILGKKFIDYYYHCHNWRVGFEVLEAAKTDSQKAFAFGYLSHLAADVISHNLFIPDKMVRTYQTLSARHAYWEIRFDLRQNPKMMQRAHLIAKNYHQKNDQLLEEVLRETLFSFKTNKKIFDGLLLLQKQERVQNFMRRVAKRSHLPLADTRAKKYQDLAQQAVLDLLKKLDNAQVVHADPAGHQKMIIAKDLRKKIKTFHREEILNEQEINRMIRQFHEILNETLFQSEMCPDAEGILTLIKEK